MSTITLKSAWKYKIDLINIFDEKFLNEKDIALQPINFILEINDNIIQENVKTKNDSNNNLSIKKSKEEKDKSGSPKVKKSKKSKSKDTSRKKSIKNTSDLYSSNIVIVNSMTEDGSECSSINKIEREVAKLKRLMSRGRSKKTNKRSSKSKLIKNSHSAKY
jgi:hypothetical protein